MPIKAVPKTARMAVIITLSVVIAVQIYLLYRVETKEAKCKDEITRWPLNIPCDVPKKPVILFAPDEVAKYFSVRLAWLVFSTLGFDVFSLNLTHVNEVWDIIWTHEFPFRTKQIQEIFSKPTVNQKINHFPGIATIGNKKALSYLNGGSKYLPKTFHVPAEKDKFVKYAMELGRDRLWVEKRTQHRNVSLKEFKEIDFESDTIIQEFIQNQFLLHGHVISLGVHVAITSISPLKVYMLRNGWMVRIATKPYHPVNVSDTETFISNAGSISLYEFESMKGYFDIAYSRKQALFAYIIKLGYNQSQINGIEKQMSDAVQDAVHKRRGVLTVVKGKQLGTHASFFDVMRWDFVLDEDLRLYLLEANFSPNLGDSRTHHLILDKNRNAIYSTINMLGFQHGNRSKNGLRDSDTTLDVAVCYTPSCDNCLHKDCGLCSQCLTHELKEMLKTSYIQHVNRLGFRKAYPVKNQNDARLHHNTEYDMHLSQRERLNRAWFGAKCLQDEYWCM